jgi:hypothetical protein
MAGVRSMPVIESLRAAGIADLRGLASALNAASAPLAK